MALSNRRRLINLLRGEPQDGILCVSDLTYWRDAQVARGDLPTKYEGEEGFLQLHLDLGVVPYYVYAREDDRNKDALSVHQIGGSGRPFNGVFGLRLEGIHTETRTVGNVMTTSYRLGRDTLTQRKAYLPDSYCYAFLDYAVRTVNDLRALRSIVEHYDFFDTSDDYRALDELWGGFGMPIAPLPRSPLSALIVDWMGVERFTYAAADYPDEVRKTLDCIDRANDEAFRLCLCSEVEIFHFCDNLSAANFASFFPLYADAYYRKRFGQLHSNSKHAAVHIDGTLRGILNQVAAVGADCAEALTTAPVGDLSVASLRREAADPSIVLWGAMPASMFTSSYARSDIETMVHTIVRSLESLKPFIAGTADQLPPDADLDLFRYAVQLLAEQGGNAL